MEKELPGLLKSYLVNFKHLLFGKPVRHVVFDLETTGLYPNQGDRVVEVGAVAIEDGCAVDHFHSLIDIGMRVPLAAQRINRINTKMTRGKPKAKDVFPWFHVFIKDSILVAHNAKFDMAFLKNEFAGLGMEMNNKCLCTWEICRKIYPGLRNYRLKTVAQRILGELPEGLEMHRALNDAMLLTKVWLELERRSRLSPEFPKHLLIPRSIQNEAG